MGKGVRGKSGLNIAEYPTLLLMLVDYFDKLMPKVITEQSVTAHTLRVEPLHALPYVSLQIVILKKQ